MRNSPPALYLVLISLLILSAGSEIVGQSAVPRFEPSICAIPVPANESNIQCGYIVVLENRNAKNGKTIRLPIVILKSDNPHPKPDPVLRTLGGPGASSLKLIRGRRSSPWLKDRDMIIFEQRGTKFAQPALECPEIDGARNEGAKRKLDRRSGKTREIAAAMVCYDRLTKQGIDLGAYNSRESAADVEDVLRTLKLEKINLYGVSYSARLMLEVMRDFPDSVRSVVLESTLPLEVNYDEVGVDGIVRSLNEMFARCRADADCAVAYPDLEKEFYAVVDRLNEHPLTVSKNDPDTKASVDVLVDGDDFVTWIVDYLFSNEPAATVDAPFVTHQAFMGKYVDQFKRDGGPDLGGSFYSWGMRYSFWCSEEMPFESRKKIAAQSTKFSALRGYEVSALPDICKVWKVPPAKPIENQPVRSDIPTLILTAEFDAYTPPAWGRSTAVNLKNSFLFEIPWAGHGPGFSVPCVHDIVAAFIDDPSARPDDDCIAKTSAKFKFLTAKP